MFMFTPALAAFSLLTRLPIARAISAEDAAEAPPWFPVIGAVIGAGQIALDYLLRPFLPPALRAVCLVTAAVFATGALHLDGLADVADGFGGGRTREETLRIMRDPAIGAFGAVAVVLIVAARLAAIATLLQRRAADAFLVCAPTVGRWTMAAVPCALPYARRDEGLGTLVAHTTKGQLAVATLFALAITATAGSSIALATWIAALLAAAACTRAMRRRLGGFTGDTLGATNEVTEVIVLIVGVALTQ